MATAFQSVDAAEAARQQLDSYLAAGQRKSLLRFITCGSVDDGKSTLIGRLLYDSKLLFEDQLAALAQESRKPGAEEDALNLALLVDGLAAEREQGITIDVAYRFFATEKRKFIVADTPGHEQYTRNMVTGASTADLAVILIDARKGVLTQTRRHSLLVHLLGIRKLVLAVNKMDLVGHDRQVFDDIVADYAAFAAEAGIGEFTAIPLSGLTGGNVTSRSDVMDWYDGPTLLDHLESVPVAGLQACGEPFRMAVQWVNRPNQYFRGYAGRVASGRIAVGDEVVVLPAGRRSTVAVIASFDGELDRAFAGQSVTIRLADEVDCSRGDIIVSGAAVAEPAGRLAATLIWMADEKLVSGRSYWLKIGTQTLVAQVDSVRSVIHVNSFDAGEGRPLGLNDIGEVEIALDRAIPAVRYDQNRKLGGFILIDRLTHATVAAGLVRDGLASAASGARDSAAGIDWIIGPGREQRAERALQRLKALGRPAFILDQAALDSIPAGEGADKVRVARELAKLMSSAGVQLLVTIEVPASEAWPGRRIGADDSDSEGADEWVI